MELLREIAFSKRIVEKKAGDLKIGDVLVEHGRITEVIERGQDGWVRVLKFHDGQRGAVSRNNIFEVII